ncbi:MAG TPA: PilZ domain-containing protein [Terriglobales bacterium]|jgi:PilZ domain
MNSPDGQPSTPALAELDRRLHPRYTLQVQIEIRQEGSDVPMRLVTTDLSRGGCYIQLMIPLSVGIRLQATLWLDGYPIVIRGLVVTRHPQFGNGIMFVEFEGQGEQLLHRYLDAIIT